MLHSGSKKTPLQKQVKALESEKWELALETQIRQTLGGLRYARNAAPLLPASKLEADFLIDGWLVVEVQGGIWKPGGHSTGAGIERDVRKLAMFTAAGFLVLQFEPKWIRSGMAILYIERVIQLWKGRAPIQRR